MDVGQRIKEARKGAGLTQKGLAEQIGAATGTIQQYELGKRQPRLEQLQAIAAALGIQVVDLLGPYDGPPLPGLADGDIMEEKGHISLEESNRLLVALGLIKEGQDLSDADLAFLANTIQQLDLWFSNRHKRPEIAPESTPAP